MDIIKYKIESLGKLFKQLDEIESQTTTSNNEIRQAYRTIDKEEEKKLKNENISNKLEDEIKKINKELVKILAKNNMVDKNDFF